VSLISVLQFGQTIVGSVITIFIPVYTGDKITKKCVLCFEILRCISDERLSVIEVILACYWCIAGISIFACRGAGTSPIIFSAIFAGLSVYPLEEIK
jgi:hypothetical protein